MASELSAEGANLARVSEVRTFCNSIRGYYFHRRQYRPRLSAATYGAVKLRPSRRAGVVEPLLFRLFSCLRWLAFATLEHAAILQFEAAQAVRQSPFSLATEP